MIDYKTTINKVLKEAKEFYASISNPSEILKDGQSGSLTNDQDLKADSEMREFFIRKLRKVPWVGYIVLEGEDGLIVVNDKIDCTVYVDELDGSLDAARAKEVINTVTISLPVAAVVTVSEKKPYEGNFSDISASGIIDLRSEQNLLVTAVLGEGVFINNKKFTLVPHTELRDGKLTTNQIYCFEAYYMENIQFATALRKRLKETGLGPDEAYWRSIGSAAWEMLQVSLGHFALFICKSQKEHELGANYLIAKELDAVVCDFQGNSLDNVPFVFNNKRPVIVCQTKSAANTLISVINQVL